jgi:hypothetical protein
MAPGSENDFGLDLDILTGPGMSNRGKARSKKGYIELHAQDEDEARHSINSSSPILPALERDSFDDEEAPLKSGATTFETDGLETFYRPIEGYEGAHRYDPEYTWSAADEKRVVRKVSVYSISLLLISNSRPDR